MLQLESSEAGFDPAELRQLTCTIPSFDDIQNDIYSTPLESMKLRQDQSFIKEIDQYLYTKAPQLSSKSRESQDKVSEAEVFVNCDETVISCAVYSSNDSAVEREIELLGTQTLGDLVKALNCVSKPSPSSISQFIFINGTFYVEQQVQTPETEGTTRAVTVGDSTIDKIKEWMKSTWESESRSILSATKKKRTDIQLEQIAFTDGDQQYAEWLASLGISDIDSIPVQSMNDTLLRELSGVKLATRYLFCHSGCCEHHLMFTGCRRYHTSVDAGLNGYPRTIYQKKHKRRRCTVCDANSAKFVAFGDRLAEVNPCYYCE